MSPNGLKSITIFGLQEVPFGYNDAIIPKNYEKQVMKHIKEFSRFAKDYKNYSTIQQNVALNLLNLIPKSWNLKRVVDIGCGDGMIYRLLRSRGYKIECFIGTDYATNMLSLHPIGDNVIAIEADFNQLPPTVLTKCKADVVISSSALQWSMDLDKTISNLKSISNRFAYAIFTSNTFKSLLECANVPSPIYTKESIINTLQNSFKNPQIVIQNMTMKFESVEEMLRYIKRSGISGGRGLLGYKDIKRVIKEYDKNYLEFEILYVTAEI